LGNGIFILNPSGTNHRDKVDTLCVDKYLNPTENKECTGFTTRDNMILLLNNIDQQIKNIPKVTHILVYYERCWYISNFNSPSKAQEKKLTRKIKSKKHIAVKVRSIVGQYITGKLGNTIQIFVLSDYVKILKQAFILHPVAKKEARYCFGERCYGTCEYHNYKYLFAWKW
jgi:hypothetical protein